MAFKMLHFVSIIREHVCHFYIEYAGFDFTNRLRMVMKLNLLIQEFFFLVVMMGKFNYVSNVASLSWDACVFYTKILFANHVH